MSHLLEFQHLPTRAITSSPSTMATDDPDFLLQQTLETLAGNANTTEASATSVEPMHATISRWQTLFALPQDAALDAIHSHRRNLTRPRVSDEHWSIIRAEQEARGFDREAYEYALELQKRRALLPESLPANEGSGVAFLVELAGPLDTAEKVRGAAGMAEEPVVVKGRSVEENREVELCCVGEEAKGALLRWAAEEGGGFEPTILVDPRSLR